MGRGGRAPWHCSPGRGCSAPQGRAWGSTAASFPGPRHAGEHCETELSAATLQASPLCFTTVLAALPAALWAAGFLSSDPTAASWRGPSRVLAARLRPRPRLLPAPGEPGVSLSSARRQTSRRFPQTGYSLALSVPTSPVLHHCHLAAPRPCSHKTAELRRGPLTRRLTANSPSPDAARSRLPSALLCSAPHAQLFPSCRTGARGGCVKGGADPVPGPRTP